MDSIWDQAHPHLRDLSLYEPGKPIEETARDSGLPVDQIVKLASNENPLGPSPDALVAMQEALKGANFYPDGGGFYLRAALSEKLDFAPGKLSFSVTARTRSSNLLAMPSSGQGWSW